jgi:hypothetical protein
MTAVHVFRNRRRGIDATTCGQAAIATLLAFHRVGPFAARHGFDDGWAIDRVRERHGPDLPLGLGTSAHRIAAALRDHGLVAEVAHSGWFGRRSGRALDRLLAHLAAGAPAPVCLDDHALGGLAGGAHWAIALGFREGAIALGNAGIASVPLERFMAVWACRHLPYGHNHCAVLAWP